MLGLDQRLMPAPGHDRMRRSARFRNRGEAVFAQAVGGFFDPCPARGLADHIAKPLYRSHPPIRLKEGETARETGQRRLDGLALGRPGRGIARQRHSPAAA